MNREILFRGKRLYNGEWIIGYLYRFSETPIAIMRKNGSDSLEVAPETVGQYTGLTDNGGKKIFEGDIIRFTHFMVRDRLYVVEWNQESAMFYLKCLGCDSSYDQEAFNTNFEYTSSEHLEIVGNIYDNPELLEVNDNG